MAKNEIFATFKPCDCSGGPSSPYLERKVGAKKCILLCCVCSGQAGFLEFPKKDRWSNADEFFEIYSENLGKDKSFPLLLIYWDKKSERIGVTVSNEDFEDVHTFTELLLSLCNRFIPKKHFSRKFQDG